MEPYRKQYIEGAVLSYDGRVYSFLLPGDETVVLKHDTVHDRCNFPAHLMENDHLKVGASIHMCIIDKNGKRSILPDHRFYYFSKFKRLSDGTVVRQKNNKTLRDFSKAIESCARMFAQGEANEAILMLRFIISEYDSGPFSSTPVNSICL